MSAVICDECTAAYSVGAPRCPQCGTPAPVGNQGAGVELSLFCPGAECASYQVRRQVPLRSPAAGVVERPNLLCAACGRHLEEVTEGTKEEQIVPKTTVHGGPSIEGAEETVVQRADGVSVHADGAIDEGGEGSSPTPEAGTASSTSSEKPQTSPETSESASRKPARMTANRSKKAPTGSSSATGTAGDRTAPTSDSDEG